MKTTESIVTKKLIPQAPIEVTVWNPSYDWHNPLKFTPEQIGADRGWRPILKKELGKLTSGFVAVPDGRGAAFGSWYSFKKVSLCDNPEKTYRTQEPLPEIERKRVLVYQFKKGCNQGLNEFVGIYNLPYEETEIDAITWGGCCTSRYLGTKEKIGYVILKGHKFIVFENGKLSDPSFHHRDGNADTVITLHGDFEL